jgi:hypothetical protein
MDGTAAAVRTCDAKDFAALMRRLARLAEENGMENMNRSYSTVALSTELLDEEVVPMGQPNEIPFVVGYADDEDSQLLLARISRRTSPRRRKKGGIASHQGNVCCGSV